MLDKRQQILECAVFESQLPSENEIKLTCKCYVIE